MIRVAADGGGWPADEIAAMRAALARGAPLIIPTESSYGLAVDPRDPVGVEAIYRLKERDRGKPLPVVAADFDQLRLLEVDPGSAAWELGRRNWPAPLTLLLALEGGRRWPAMADASTLACRIPAHALLRALLARLACPLTATSANRAGEPALVDPESVAAWLADDGGLDAVLIDGGLLPGGAPSTVVAVDADGNTTVLRAGAFPPEQLPTRARAQGL